jgi:hypothetical protein
MRCRLALPAVLTLLVLPCGTGCRLGGGSSMTSWLPGQGSVASQGEELASAPPFEGEIVKPSSKATPYPTTSTPEGYVVPGDPETASEALVAAAPPVATDPSGRAMPVTYGMKPPEVATMADVEASQNAPTFGAAPAAPVETIAAQEGPYGPLGGAETPTATPPADTVTSRFGSASGTSDGAYPPEQTVGIAPAAGSAFAADPAASDPPLSAAPEGYATTAPVTSAFGQAPPVQQGSASDSPVASSRYAAAGGSQFGGAVPATQSSAFPAAAGDPPVASGSTWPPAPVESVANEPVAETSTQASAWLPPPAASGPSSYDATERSFDVAGPAADAATPDAPAFDVQAVQPPSESGGLKRRPDPMYRPAGTSSYQPSAPIFSDEPASRSPVQMATFDEPVAGVTATSPSPYSIR